MKAARIHRFGPPDVISIDDVSCPEPDPDQVLVRVAAAGVGPWDALIREQKSVVQIPLPITLGSDFAGVVELAGAGVTHWKPGDEVYGATNPQFIGAYAEYALASPKMIARKPQALSFREAASVPVVAVTAWQMLFDHAKAQPGQSVLIHGAAGNVGAFAVQLARRAGLHVFATAASSDLDFVRGLGAETAIDYQTTRFEDVVPPVDIVLDMVGGETRRRSFGVIRPAGILVSVVSNEPPDEDVPNPPRTVFFLVEVTTARLDQLTALFDRHELRARVGSVLPLDQARVAHEMLAGAPHERGKIVLDVSDLP